MWRDRRDRININLISKIIFIYICFFHSWVFLLPLDNPSHPVAQAIHRCSTVMYISQQHVHVPVPSAYHGYRRCLSRFIAQENLRLLGHARLDGNKFCRIVRVSPWHRSAGRQVNRGVFVVPVRTVRDLGGASKPRSRSDHRWQNWTPELRLPLRRPITRSQGAQCENNRSGDSYWI